MPHCTLLDFMHSLSNLKVLSSVQRYQVKMIVYRMALFTICKSVIMFASFMFDKPALKIRQGTVDEMFVIVSPPGDKNFWALLVSGGDCFWRFFGHFTTAVTATALTHLNCLSASSFTNRKQSTEIDGQNRLSSCIGY